MQLGFRKLTLVEWLIIAALAIVVLAILVPGFPTDFGEGTQDVPEKAMAKRAG